MSLLQISRAVRKGSFILASLAGASGSGKTYSAILLARGLVGPQGKMAMLDTETGRGRLYADIGGGFDYAELPPPFGPDRYITAIDEIEAAGFDALVIDSGSHEWEGIGGVAELAENVRNAKGELRTDYGKWARPKALHKRFVSRLLSARMHIIVCLRARQPVKEEVGASGRKEVVLQDYKPICEKNFMYELTVSAMLYPDGSKKLTKCPDALLPAFGAKEVGEVTRERITVATGETIAKWVAGGTPISNAEKSFAALKRTGEQKAEIGTEALRAWWKLLSADDRASMKPHMAALGATATEADAASKEPASPEDDGWPGPRP